MTSWETSDAHLDDQYGRDFVLKQPSTVGPWVALVLGVALLTFLGSLVYVNFLLPSPTVAPDYAWRAEAELAPPVARTKRSTQRALERHKSSFTRMPQGRAPNALLGGQGPALPPEYVVPTGVSSGLRVPTPSSSARE